MKKLDINASADVNVDLYGNAAYLTAKLSADVKLSDYDLIVDDLKLNMAADCAANVTVNKTISVDAAADCVLNYKGHATIIHQKLKADSRINKID